MKTGAAHPQEAANQQGSQYMITSVWVLEQGSFSSHQGLENWEPNSEQQYADFESWQQQQVGPRRNGPQDGNHTEAEAESEVSRTVVTISLDSDDLNGFKI